MIDIEGQCLLTDSNSSSSISDIKVTCGEVAATCKQKWMEEVPNLIDKIGKRLDEEEKGRIKKEKEEEAARIKRQKEEDEARNRKEKEEERAIKEAEEREALLKQKAESKERNRLLRKKILRYALIAFLLHFIAFVVFAISEPTGKVVLGILMIADAIFLGLLFYVYIPYKIIKWIIKKYKK